MAAYFLDSSAAAKLYVLEPGSSWVTQLVVPAQQHELFVVRITAVEIAAAIFRRVKAGTLSTDDAIGAVAALRGYDCVQLAAAVAVHRVRLSENASSLNFASADLELNAAARAEGLEVSNPNEHP